MMSSDNADGWRGTPPLLPPDSPGSSVSSRLQEEYTELLKHVVISSAPEGGQNLEIKNLEESQTNISTAVPALSLQNSEKIEQVQTPRSQSDQKNLTSDSQNLSIQLNQSADNFNQNQSSHTYDSQPNENDNDTDSSDNLLSSLTDPTVTEFGQHLDGWLGVLKSNIMSQISASSLLLLQKQQQQHEQEMKDLVSDKQRLEREVNRLSELVATCEQSMSRKDTLLDNLTQGLAKQRDRTKAAQCFFNWRVELLDASREKFCEKIAVLHHEKQLVQRVLRGWFGQVQTRWRTRVERKCQDQAQGVCRQLSQDYEAKIAALNSTVSDLQRKVLSLQTEKEQYAESVKKAFMRGVCALNMEAMSAFTPEDSGAAGTGEEESFMENTYFEDATSSNFRLHTDNMNSSHPAKHSQLGKTGFSDLATTSMSPDSIQMSSVPALSRSLSPQNKPHSKKDKQKAKNYSLQGQVLAPPMASIVVERHQPVTKQTVGKATASKYPKHAGSQSRSVPPAAARPHPSSSASQTFKPLAGQTVKHSYKLVE